MGGKGDSGGGGSTFYLRKPEEEYPVIKQWARKWTGTEFPRFVKKDPIWKPLYRQAADYATAGPSPILAESQSQALEGLQSQGQLSPEEYRAAQDRSLALAGTTGMTGSPGTIGTTVLNTAEAEATRRAEDRAYAGQVEGQTLQSEQQHMTLPMAVASGAAGTFGGLTNPILDYLGKAFTPTVGQAPAGDNKSGETGQLVGTIISAAATAY